MDDLSIHALERAAMSAWPALETIDEAGWVLRFAGGYTRRSNCATALGPAQGSLGGRFHWCERAFAARSLPPVFRVLSAGGPAGLDDELRRAGYARGDEAVVMTRELADAPALGGAALPDAMALDPWLDLYDRSGGKLGANRHTHRALLEAIPGERLLAAIDADGERAGERAGFREGYRYWYRSRPA